MFSLIRSLFFRTRYLFNPPWDTGISPPELLQFLQQDPPGRALDLGCGTGTNVITMARHGWQAAGVDFVPRAIRAGRRKAKKAGVEVDLIVADVTDLDRIFGQYDLVLDIGCYHSLDQDRRVTYRKNLSLILKPGAIFMLYAFTSARENRRRSMITDEDVQAFRRFLSLEKREDGSDRGLFSSSWFWFSHTENTRW